MGFAAEGDTICLVFCIISVIVALRIDAGRAKEMVGSRWKQLHHPGEGKEVEAWIRMVVMESVRKTELQGLLIYS